MAAQSLTGNLAGFRGKQLVGWRCERIDFLLGDRDLGCGGWRAVGSFLNVVVYRLPAGMSLSHPGSHCPKCKWPIRWHDNVPVRLADPAGRAATAGRGFRSAIRWWKPLVAAIFLIVAIAEGASGARTLLFVRAGGRRSHLSGAFGELAGLVGWHPVAPVHPGGLNADRPRRARVPARLFLPGLLVGLAGSWIWPHLHFRRRPSSPLGPAREFSMAWPGWALGACWGCRRVVAGSPGRFGQGLVRGPGWALSRLAAGGR